MFSSDFPCVVCDQKTEEHSLCIQDEGERRREGQPVKEDYQVLSQLPAARSAVFRGRSNSRFVRTRATAPSGAGRGRGGRGGGGGGGGRGRIVGSRD